MRAVAQGVVGGAFALNGRLSAAFAGDSRGIELALDRAWALDIATADFLLSNIAFVPAAVNTNKQTIELRVTKVSALLASYTGLRPGDRIIGWDGAPLYLDVDRDLVYQTRVRLANSSRIRLHLYRGDQLSVDPPGRLVRPGDPWDITLHLM